MTVQNNLKKNTDDTTFIKKHGKTLLLAAFGLIGIFLLLYGGGKLSGTGTSPKKEDTSEHADIAEYTDRLEESIVQLCSNVEGVSGVTVAVTLKSGYEYVYAAYSDNKTDGSVEIKYITIGSGSSKTPVYITEKLPEIAGIGIVCRGGSNPAIQQKLIDLISAAYNIGSNKIYITGS